MVAVQAKREPSSSGASWPPLPEELPPVPLAIEVKVAARAARAALPPLGRPGAGKLLIFGQGRTGSTLLGELLASHPDFEFGNELLRPRVRWPLVYLEGRRAEHPRGGFGVHIKPYHLTDFQGVSNLRHWLERAHRRGWTVVHLYRENLLRQVLSTSSLIAMGGVSHLRTGDRTGPPRLSVDPAELLHWMDLRARSRAAETQALIGVPHETVSYERDLLTGQRWQSLAERLWSSVGLSPVPVTTSLRKINSDSLPALLLNYDEVAAALRGSPYERFLDPSA